MSHAKVVNHRALVQKRKREEEKITQVMVRYERREEVECTRCDGRERVERDSRETDDVLLQEGLMRGCESSDVRCMRCVYTNVRPRRGVAYKTSREYSDG